MVTLLVTLLLGFSLASYLLLVRSEHTSTARSQAWHQALVMAETGVEEALAQLNPSAFTSEVVGGNGWSLYDGFYQPEPPERNLIGGRYAVVYTADNPPTISSTGYTAFPFGSVTLSRVVRVTTTNAPSIIPNVMPMARTAWTGRLSQTHSVASPTLRWPVCR